MKKIILLLLFAAAGAAADTLPAGPAQIEIRRAAAPIAIDGNVTESEWAGAVRVDRWFEFNPGDNVEPTVKTVAYLAYDQRFLYAAFVNSDPNPQAIRASYADRDGLSEYDDFAGLMVSPTGDGKTGVELLANPRGIQMDGITSDATGEDYAPDFFWDTAARITNEGWMLEIRIPFSSLRYLPGNEQRWTIAFYRNYPRERRYQFASSVIPRGSNCFVCLFTPLVGLRDLPSSSHVVVAPYTTLGRDSTPQGDLGSPLRGGDVESRIGADVKWLPTANAALDATINPDFSQIESDAPVITANERFAVFLSEKRPFFLEGKDLFGMPIDAVYTRDINSPRWGARATGRVGNNAYTVVVADDRGGGAVIIPGPNHSSMASQDFESRNLIGRLRHDIGNSFASFLVTDREIEGGGHNRVFGPDFVWSIGKFDRISGQLLLSRSETPNRPDLADEWDGRSLSSHAAQLTWSHSTPKLDSRLELIDRGDEFRADLGFVPQVGIREAFGQVGYTFRPKGFFNKVRPYVEADYTGQRNGDLVYRFVQPGIEANGLWTTWGELQYSIERVRAGSVTIKRNAVEIEVSASPSRIVKDIGFELHTGSDIDFEHARPADGSSIEAFATIRATEHLDLELNSEYRTIDVLDGQRLFAARVGRLKAMYNFSSRSFLRVIGQYERTDTDPMLYRDEVPLHDASHSLSILYAFKLNWQTLLYAGYGDLNQLTETNRYEPALRSVFVKLSYAWQR